MISEVGDGQMFRSQSVGHSMAVVTANGNDGNKLLNINYNCNGSQENGITQMMKTNGKLDGMRYTLSQPLLINSASEHENKPLKESHKHWRSGTLSRPDIFYQVRDDFNTNISINIIMLNRGRHLTFTIAVNY